MINALQQLALSLLRPAQPTASSPSAEPAVAEVFNSRDVMEVVLAHAVRADAGSAAANTQDARFVAWTKLRLVNKATRAAAEGRKVVGALLGARPQMDIPHHAALSANRLQRNLALGRCRQSTLAGPAGLLSIAYSPDGMHLASGSDDGTVRLWDLSGTSPTASVLTGHTHWVRSVAFSPDGGHLASGSEDRTVRLWDLSGTSPTASVLTGHTDWVRSIAFSPDGRHLASGSADRTLRLWDLRGRSPTASVLTGHTGSVTSVAFSPDGRHLASGSSGPHAAPVGPARHVAHRQSSLQGHTQWVNSVAFSPDGRHLASGSSDGTLRLWDLSGTSPTASRPYRGTPTRSAPSRSPRTACTSPAGQETARCACGTCAARRLHPASLQGHTDWVTSVAFSPDGMHLASGSSDRTLRLWNFDPGPVPSVA